MSAEERASDRQQRDMLASTAVLIICGSSYFSMLLGVLRSVLVMRMLGPSAQGIRKIVDLFNKYLSNAHLGVLHGVNKQVPLLLGQNDRQQVQAVEDVGITWIIALTLAASVAMAVIGLFSPTGHLTTGLAITIGAGALLVGQTYTVYRTMARAWGNFAALGIVGGVETIVTFVFTLAGAWKFGVLGTMIGGLIASCIALLVLSGLAPIRIRVDFNLKLGFELARIGLPIAIYIFADTLLRSVDQTIIGWKYEAYRFGLYSMATQIAAYLYAIPESAGFVIWPKIMQAYGAADGDHTVMRRQIVLPTLMAGIFMPVLAGIAFIVLPPMVSLVLPKYVDGIAAAQMLGLGAVFLAIPMATNSLLIARSHEYLAVLAKFAGAAVGAAGCWWVVNHGGSLMALAIAASVGYGVAAAVSVGIVLPQYENSLWRTVRMFFSVFAPFLWSMVCLKTSSLAARIVCGGPHVAMFPGAEHALELGWGYTGVRLGVFLLLMVPLLIYGDYKTHAVREVRAMVRSWGGRS